MDWWINFLCRRLGHHRNRSSIQFNCIDQRYESVCKRCQVKMVRTPERQWKVADDLED